MSTLFQPGHAPCAGSLPSASPEVQELLRRVVSALGRRLGAEAGHVLVVSQGPPRDGVGRGGQERLRSTGIWRVSRPERIAGFMASREGVALRSGEGTAGVAWVEGRPTWGAMEAPGVPPPPVRTGSTGWGLAIPLPGDGGTPAVLEFFSVPRPSRSLVHALSGEARLLGAVLSRMLDSVSRESLSTPCLKGWEAPGRDLLTRLGHGDHVGVLAPPGPAGRGWLTSVMDRGLERGMRVVVLTDPEEGNGLEAAAQVRYLGAATPQVGGSLSLVSGPELLAGGKDSLSRWLESELERTRCGGHDGLWLVAELAWALYSDRDGAELIRFEELLHRRIRPAGAVAVCHHSPDLLEHRILRRVSGLHSSWLGQVDFPRTRPSRNVTVDPSGGSALSWHEQARFPREPTHPSVWSPL